MNKYLKNLNRIEFVVTNACTGKCKHCSQGEHNGLEHLDKDIAADAVRRIASEYKIDSVMTFGGEALLFPECVCEIHKTAEEVGIKKRQLITNGYFSKDVAGIEAVADMLAFSGVNEILLSVDAFHQETIPLEYVLTFAKLVFDRNIKILVQPAWLISADEINPYNNKTRELLYVFNKMGIAENEGNIIFPSGNALRYLSEYFENCECPENPYVQNPEDIKAISISANGDILGKNIYKQNILDILTAYNP